MNKLIKEFVKEKEITYKELESLFVCVREVVLDRLEEHSCHCFRNKGTVKYLPSEPWTRVLYCYGCHTITMQIEQDAMGLSTGEVYRVYKQNS